jgi:hypothetical protein
MNAFLTLLLTLVCAALVALDIHGVSLSGMLSRFRMAMRVRRNLCVSLPSAWRITGGRPS